MPFGAIKIVAIILILGASFGAGWSWRGSRCEEVRIAAIADILKKEAAEREKLQLRADSAAQALESDLATQRARTKELSRRLEHEISNSAYYRECVATPDSVRAINDAIKSRSKSTSGINAEVP